MGRRKGGLSPPLEPPGYAPAFFLKISTCSSERQKMSFFCRALSQNKHGDSHPSVVTQVMVELQDWHLLQLKRQVGMGLELEHQLKRTHSLGPVPVHQFGGGCFSGPEKAPGLSEPWRKVTGVEVKKADPQRRVRVSRAFLRQKPLTHISFGP